MASLGRFFLRLFLSFVFLLTWRPLLTFSHAWSCIVTLHHTPLLFFKLVPARSYLVTLLTLWHAASLCHELLWMVTLGSCFSRLSLLLIFLHIWSQLRLVRLGLACSRMGTLSHDHHACAIFSKHDQYSSHLITTCHALSLLVTLGHALSFLFSLGRSFSRVSHQFKFLRTLHLILVVGHAWSPTGYLSPLFCHECHACSLFLTHCYSSSRLITLIHAWLLTVTLINLARFFFKYNNLHVFTHVS
jgi:hypothetical protein